MHALARLQTLRCVLLLLLAWPATISEGQSGEQHEAAAGAVPTGGRTRETAGQRYAAPPAQD